MVARLKSVLAMLMVLFILGASSQPALCELACGLGMHSSSCHSEDAAGASAKAQDMPGMEHGHCGAASHKASELTQNAGLARCSVHASEAACNHPAALATQASAPASIDQATIHWSVFGVVQPGSNTHSERSLLGATPPLRLAALDPLLVTLRV
jgi:hypothetical protein